MPKASKKKVSKRTPSNVAAGDKAGKFRELAEKRMTKLLKATRQIRNLSNRNSYEYTDEHAAKIVATLKREVELIEKAFSGGPAASETFTL